jgi:DNA modification methylase
MHKPSGFGVEMEDLNPALFEWQKLVTRWALFTGKSALFEGCGLGKTVQEIEWSTWVHRHTGGDVLILAPIAVSYQTAREAEKFGYRPITICRNQSDVRPGINITNYEKLDKFDPDKFAGVVLDESSILKAFMGKTKQELIQAFKKTPYKLCGTATPSPNDYMELLNHSDFLDVMPSNEALSRWFINDTSQFGTYRLRGHAVDDFWRWVASWAVCINKPSGIGFDDNGFILPPLKTIKHIVEYDDPLDLENGQLFRETKVISASNLYRELRETAEKRCGVAARMVNDSDDGWIVWCNTNKEAELLTDLIYGAVNVHGSMAVEAKEKHINDFLSGAVRVLVTKPSMCGFGLNFQHVNHQAFVGLSFSFEQRYQAVRRLWRFGQEKEVYDHVILSPAENQVFNAVLQKEKHQVEMEQSMVKHMKNYYDLKSSRRELEKNYERKVYSGKDWTLHLGDCCEEMAQIPDASVHFSIFSPPFSNLYIYSDMLQDMGNCKNDDEFFTHFGFTIKELYRILTPGRLCAVHCKDLVDYKSRDGESGLRDVPGEIIRRFESHGFKYHSRVTIWKDPVIEMQRTKAQGLLHAQIKRDSSMSRNGLPDYLLVFRKWPQDGQTSGPNPVHRPEGFKYYIGENVPAGDAYQLKENELGIHELVKIPKGDEIFSIHVWQRYASPVWFDIRQTEVLNCRIARDDKDEKHICPLQLDVIRRAVHLWTLPGDTVFTPFAGIGSELYAALELGRKAIGIELKKSYAEQAAKFLSELQTAPQQMELFG